MYNSTPLYVGDTLRRRVKKQVREFPYNVYYVSKKIAIRFLQLAVTTSESTSGGTDDVTITANDTTDDDNPKNHVSYLLSSETLNIDAV